MRKIRKPVSILLSVVMILSMFTVLSVTSASAATIQVFARKWVRAEQVTGDYFSFTDLYQNFIICRGNPHFDETNYNIDDTANVYNRTETITLTNHNEVRLNRWDNDNGKLNYYWADNAENAGNGKIYLSTNGDGINFNTDEVKWYAYTWETFTVDEVAATSPTYQNGAYEYGYGEHYTGGNRNFVAIEGTTDGHQNVRQIAMAEVKIPYFEYEYINYLDTIRLVKCNSDDADVTVPDAIPSQFYPSDAPAGKTCSIIKENAFTGCTNLVNVTIENNVTHLAGTSTQDGSFYNCTALKTVTVGSNLDYVGAGCFQNCTSLTDFTTTSEKTFGKVRGVEKIAYTNNGLTVHCYHDSDFARQLSSNTHITLTFLDEEVDHTYKAKSDSWDWINFDEETGQGSVTVDIECTVCGMIVANDVQATVVEVVDTPATCTTTGSGHYKAVVTYDGATFEDDEPIFSFTIPADANAHDWDMDDEDAVWTWTPSGGEDPGLRSITAKVTVHCKGCTATQDVNGVVEENGADMPGCTTAGARHYIATAEFNGKTFTGTKDYTLPAYNSHQMTYHPAKEATATENGNIAYYTCDRCGKYFSDSNGDNWISVSSTVIPALNTIADGKVFKVGDPLVVPATTSILVYHENSSDGYVASGFKTDTPVLFSDDQNGSLMRGENYTAVNIYNSEFSDDYAFTGLYMTKFESRHGINYYRVVPLYYNRANAPEWSAWDAGDVAATATLSSFYSLQDGIANAEQVAYTQTLEATVTSGDTTPGDCVTQATTTYTANVSVYNYTASDSKEVTGSIDPDNHNLSYYPAHEPGLTTTGNIEFWYCTRCGKLFSDPNGLNEITAQDTLLPMTAVAQIGNSYYTDSLRAAVIRINTDMQYYDSIILLQDADLEYDAALCQSCPSFKVKKNGHTITTTVDPCYTLYESPADENGVTTYEVTHNWVSDNTVTYYTLGSSEGSYTVTPHIYCTVCGEDYAPYSANATKHAAVAPTTTSEGNVEYYRTNILGAVSYFVPAENPAHENELTAVDAASVVIPKLMAAVLAGHSISLDGDIGVNFYMTLSQDVIDSQNTPYMLFRIPNTSAEYQTQKAYLSDAERKGDYYLFKCRVAAKDMESAISAQMIDGENKSAVYTCSVKRYADYLIEHQDDNQTFKDAVELVQAMLQYGTYAQNYFSDADALSDIDTTIPESVYTATENAEALFDGATLSLKSQTTLSLYFKSTAPLTLSIDGKTEGVDYELENAGSEYVIRIRNIAAYDLDKPVTVNVNGEDTLIYSPLTYCYKAQTSGDTKLANTVKALYAYHLAAKEYF